jgi:hypothetical protein
MRKAIFLGASVFVAIAAVVLWHDPTRNNFGVSTGLRFFFHAPNPPDTPNTLTREQQDWFKLRYKDGYEWAWGYHYRCPPSQHSAKYIAEAWQRGYQLGIEHGGQFTLSAFHD